MSQPGLNQFELIKALGMSIVLMKNKVQSIQSFFPATLLRTSVHFRRISKVLEMTKRL